MRIKLMDIINESKDHKHEFGCVMLNFNFPQMSQIHDKIDSDDIYEDPDDDSFGLEKESHVTLLYGLHKGVSDDDVKTALSGITFNTCKLYNPSIFENEKYDVLKFDVGYVARGGSFLSKANRELKKFPNTNDFPDYHPHMTIAYAKKGTGKKYANELKGKEYVITPDYAKYSKIDGSKVKFKISLQK